MHSNEFTALAGKLAAQTSIGAAGYRTAISRAYYGSFHAARRFLVECFTWYCHGDNEHQWVQRHFQNCRSTEAREIGYGLVHLHTLRKSADYDLDDADVELQSQAMASVARATDINQSLAALANDPMLEQIHEEMQDYRQRVNLL